MLIRASNGVAVRLRPLRWQFPPDAGPWDDRWLIVSGHIDQGDQRWSFSDPCLLIEEARELAQWLRDAANGRAEPDRTPPDQNPQPSLSFIEPALGFSIAEYRADKIVIRVHLTAESAPPWLRNDDPHTARHTIELPLRPNQLLDAAEAWTQQLDALPPRSWADTG